MISSRRLEDLYPVVAEKAKAHIASCSAEGIDLLVTCTYRDAEAQNALWAQGRTKPGAAVTNARGGQSLHNFRCAYDVVPLRQGKPVWGTTGLDEALWKKVGMLGLAEGLEWAGQWTSFREFPHFQFTGGLTLAELAKGAIPSERRSI